MKINDSEDFRQLMTTVYDFYGKVCTHGALDIWWQAMSPYDFDAVKDALNKHCVNPDNGQFLPKPADAVRMIEGSTVDSAMKAWSKVDRAVSSVGTYATVVFDDPLIHRVITDMGGWTLLGSKAVTEWPFVAKEFQTRYRGFTARREMPEYPERLIGLADGENTRRGYPMGRPVFIGDTKKAQALLSRAESVGLLEAEQ